MAEPVGCVRSHQSAGWARGQQAGKLREGRPDRLEQAGTRSWATEGHFLIVDVDDERMTVHPVTDFGVDGELTYLRATTPDGQGAPMPIVVPR
ncbi:MAG: hypothetical protein WD250_16095 [Egibacteraceae bacterium]